MVRAFDWTYLSTAMHSARCQYGLQLDMNPGHTGFEFYRVGRKGTLPDLGRKLDTQWEAKGAISDAVDWEFMSRRMMRYMNLMHFPRYIRAESRDFFYLTERRLLPLGPVAPVVDPPERDEGAWQTKGLPQRGWPPAIATCRFRPDPTRPTVWVTLIALDCSWLQILKDGDSRSPTVVAIEPNESTSKSSSLWFWNESLRVQNDSPGAGARRIASGTESTMRRSRVAAAIGQVNDPIWIYAEVSGSTDHSRDVETLDRAFANVGARARLYFGQPINIQLGNPPTLPPSAVIFARQQGPRGLRIFENTPIVASKEWIPLQERRIRYKRQPKAAQLPSETDSAKTQDAKSALNPETVEQP